MCPWGVGQGKKKCIIPENVLSGIVSGEISLYMLFLSYCGHSLFIEILYWKKEKKNLAYKVHQGIRNLCASRSVIYKAPRTTTTIM